MRRVIWLQSLTVLWLVGGTIYLSCSMYVRLLILGRQIHTAETLVPEPSTFGFSCLLKRWKVTNYQVLNKYQYNCLKQGVEQLIVRSINLLIRSRLRSNCLRSGMSLLLYLFIRKAIKQITVLTETTLLSNTYKILCKILLSSLTPYI
jgi:hypothetical protein